jgi:hypothetical protein
MDRPQVREPSVSAMQFDWIQEALEHPSVCLIAVPRLKSNSTRAAFTTIQLCRCRRAAISTAEPAAFIKSDATQPIWPVEGLDSTDGMHIRSTAPACTSSPTIVRSSCVGEVGSNGPGNPLSRRRRDGSVYISDKMTCAPVSPRQSLRRIRPRNPMPS